MFDKNKLIMTAAVMLLAADNIRMQRRIRKVARAALELDQSKETVVAVQNLQLAYLCHLLDKHDVPVEEFDLIALNFQNQ